MKILVAINVKFWNNYRHFDRRKYHFESCRLAISGGCISIEFFVACTNCVILLQRTGSGHRCTGVVEIVAAVDLGPVLTLQCTCKRVFRSRGILCERARGNSHACSSASAVRSGAVVAKKHDP